MTTEIAGFIPTARQRQIWDTIRAAPRGSLTLIGYGGAAGGGKTRSLSELALDIALTYPGVRILVARRDLVDLRSTTLDSFDANTPPGLVVRRTDSPMVVRYVRDVHWPEGVTSAIHFRELKDWLSIASEEYGAALLEEAGEIPKDAALMVLSRLRHPAAKKYVVVAASNPWPGWFEDWFVKREIDEQVLAAAGGRITFIPAFISDNPHLPENYEALLRAMYPDDWVARLVEGRFGGYKGQVYDALGPHLQWMGALPDFERIVGGLDFGGANPEAHKTAGVAGGLTKSNRLVRFGHFEHAGGDVHDELFTWMMQVEAKVRRRVQWRADKTQSWGISQARRIGFQIVPSHGGADSVMAGITLVKRRLSDGSSFYTEALTQRPTLEGRPLNGQAWYDSMSRYRWQDQPDPDRAVPGVPIKRDDDTCIAGEVPIMMADGTTKPMADVQAGDVVMTLDGPSLVLAHWLAAGNADTVQIGQLRCTPDHQMLYTDTDGYEWPDSEGVDDLLRVEWSPVQAIPGFTSSRTSRLLAASYADGRCIPASRSLGGRTRTTAGGMGDSPHRSRPDEQRSIEFGSVAVARSPRREAPGVARQWTEACSAGDRTRPGMAPLGGGASLAPRTWEVDVDRPRGSSHDVSAVRRAIYHQARIRGPLQVLLRTVQSPRPAGKTAVYDLTVAAPSHTFIAGGFVVSNCDADRYMHEEADGFPIQTVRQRVKLA